MLLSLLYGNPKLLLSGEYKALILDETRTKFLLVQEDNKWELPGGGLDWGESPVEGLTRESRRRWV